MQMLQGISNKNLFLAIFTVVCIASTLIYYENSFLTYSFLYHLEETAHFGESNFIVSSSKCKILDLEPFNKDANTFFHPENYRPCHFKKLMTYVTKTDNIATLHIDKEVVPSYTERGVSCCYSNVTRNNNVKNPDDGISISACELFETNVTIHSYPVLVKCKEVGPDTHIVYENVHVTVVTTEKVQKKLDFFKNTTEPFSVLFIGIDSISRLNFIRSLPNTYKFVEDNGWISLKGYNKIEDNTFPNIMAILTGYNQSHANSICDPETIGKLDECSIIWYDFQKLGFVTAYAEDEGQLNTFNYKKKGFKNAPTDYYFRPYILASEKLKKEHKDGMTYCTGPESAGERIMNIARDFAITFKEYPYFGFFWMNSFSHNNINSPTGMDNKVKEFLEDLAIAGVMKKSIVIFLSDHGMRFGGIRLTDTGWLEERLPFIYVSFPEWFRQNHLKKYETFKNNSKKLTSPYDLHMTLKNILVLSGDNDAVYPSNACPKCKSLFDDVESERSCEDAGIVQHWCTCAGYSSTNLENKLEITITNFALEKIHGIIRSENSAHKCAKYSLEKILDIKVSETYFLKNESFLLLKLKTNPNAVFETTIRFSGDIKTSNLSLMGDISRLDNYNDHSECVDNAYLKKYCYCRSGGIKAS